MNITEAIQTQYHLTSFEGFTPAQADMLKAAQSELTVLDTGLEPIITLGLSESRWVPYYLACKSSKAAADTGKPRWDDMDMPEQGSHLYLCPRVEQGQVPGPELFVVNSATTGNTAICVVIWKTVDAFTGWPEFQTAEALVVERYHGVTAWDEAKEKVSRMRTALARLATAGRLSADWAEKRQVQAQDERAAF